MRGDDSTTSVDEPLPAHRRPEGVDGATVERSTGTRDEPVDGRRHLV